ncbi:MAG: phosphotransferase enzyme family protein [Mucilaginibacter sp.]
MSIFPAQYSTLSSSALNDFFADRYGFENTSCRLLIRNVSDTYVLESRTNKYIFRIYRDAHRKLEEIKGEVELLAILAGKGARVSYPVADAGGNMVQAFNAAEGTRHGVLFTYASGGVIYDMSDSQLAVLGREIAAIHIITSTNELSHQRIVFDVDTTINEPLKALKPAFTDLPGEYRYLQDTARTVIETLGSFNLKQFSYGYCHYDFLPKNFHFDEYDQVTFFDFDFAGKGYLANDITSLYVHYFLEVAHGRITRDGADRSFGIFVEHYRKVRPLQDEELKAIPYLGFAFWVFYLGFAHDNFDDWSSPFFGPKFLKERVALIKKWMDFFEV